MSTDEQILNDLYGLTPEQVVIYDKLSVLVDNALEQFDQGFAVNVEDVMAELAKEFCP